jgi:branched-chain amino acid transport system substrate-binding protein
VKKARIMSAIVASVCMLFFVWTGPTLAQDVVKVGAVQAVRGAFSFCFININDGLKDALTMANEKGGINGKRIEYIWEPTDYNVEESKKKFADIYAKHSPKVMFGNSTGLSKALADKITNTYKVLYTSSSFSAAVADENMYPSMFVPGPTYGEQIGILLMHIARTKPKAKVAFFFSDTAFGKDPIPYAKILCRRLRLNTVAEISVPLQIQDVSKQVLELKRARPDFVIFQGFVENPVPAVIKGCRQQGMTCKFMGTFWGATKTILDKLGPLADGYMVVNPYAYWWDTQAPMIQKIKAWTAQHYPEVTYRPNYYMEGFAAGLIFVEVMKRADKAGKLNYEGLVEALRSLKNFDTGGLTAPLTIKNNRFPVARVYEADAMQGIFKPVSDWINLD